VSLFVTTEKSVGDACAATSGQAKLELVDPFRQVMTCEKPAQGAAALATPAAVPHP
jgi:hypothetical protein